MAGTRIQGVNPKEYKGVKYRSTLEADTAEVLDLLGISFYYESRTITLLEGFRCPYQKDKVRSIHYTPDFIIGNIMIECKGFETPEWKQKKKYVFKYLMENEPKIHYYQTKNCTKDILLILNSHMEEMGIKVQVTSKSSKKKPSEVIQFNTLQEAINTLHLEKKQSGAILKSLTGKKEFVYNYNWKLIKIEKNNGH